MVNGLELVVQDFRCLVHKPSSSPLPPIITKRYDSTGVGVETLAEVIHVLGFVAHPYGVGIHDDEVRK